MNPVNNAINLPLPPPIHLSNLSSIPKGSSNSDQKKNIPPAPPLISFSQEKKVVKKEIKKEEVKQPKIETVSSLINFLRQLI